MIKTKGIYHIGIPVNDLERAIRFYTEILGMKVTMLNRDDMGPGAGRAELQSGDGIVVLFQRPNSVDRDVVREDGATHQAFMVDQEDFELAVKNMEAWGGKNS